jgi:hypothetical protein
MEFFMINKLLYVYFCVIIGLIVGYGINIYKLYNCDFDPISKEEVIRGIFTFS